jgi:hypothetical protein
MRITRRSAAMLGATAVIGLGAIPALAQDTTETATEDTATSTWEDAHADREAAFADALAEELGLDTDTVAEAIATVREELQAERRAERLAVLQERLDQAVADGELTQEQADALIAAHEAGVIGGRRGPGGRHGGHGFGPGRGA